mmetsp:Transcript_2094/g.9498  ORF Transcript_2094/g.9498 Transcript_2094/m.9498 type:complete len:255 (-) Transcript_2094:863-1627(-)
MDIPAASLATSRFGNVLATASADGCVMRTSSGARNSAACIARINFNGCDANCWAPYASAKPYVLPWNTTAVFGAVIDAGIASPPRLHSANTSYPPYSNVVTPPSMISAPDSPSLRVRCGSTTVFGTSLDSSIFGTPTTAWGPYRSRAIFSTRIPSWRSSFVSDVSKGLVKSVIRTLTAWMTSCARASSVSAACVTPITLRTGYAASLCTPSPSPSTASISERTSPHPSCTLRAKSPTRSYPSSLSSMSVRRMDQ